MTGDHMKIFGSILTAGGLLLASCSTPPADADWDTQPEAKGTETAQKPAEAGEKPQDPGGMLTAQSLDKQRRQFLRDKYLSMGRKLADQLKYEAARDELLKAQKVAPNDLEVRRQLAFVLQQLGDRRGTVQTRSENLVDLEQARLEMLRLEAEGAYQKAVSHHQFKEYDKAIQRVNEVLMHIELGKSRVDYNDLPQRAEALKKQVIQEKRETLARQKAELERRTFAELRTKERKARLQQETKIHALWKEAIAAYERESYEVVTDRTEQILVLDPTHVNARTLFDMAEKAKLTRNNNTYRRQRKEEFRKWRDSLAELKIPYGTDDPLVRPDRNVWREKGEMRKRMSDLGLSQTMDPADQLLLKKLDKLRIGGAFEEGTAFMDVVSYMQNVTGLPVVLTPAAREAVESDAVEIQMDLAVKVTVRSFLDLLMKKATNLAYQVQDGMVFITTKEGKLGQKLVRVHDISDLIFGLSSFAPPKIDSLRIGGSGDSETGPMGGIVGDPVKTVDPDELTNMIRQTIMPGSWDAEGINLEAMGNQLIVVHSAEVQRKVIQYLNELRRYTTSIVTIDSKFLTISENWLMEVGVEWRGLGGEGDNPAETEAQLDDLTQGLDDNTSRGFDNSGTGTANDPAAPPTAGIFYNDGGDGDMRARTENIFNSALGNMLTTKGGATIGISILDDMQMRALLRMVEKEMAFQLVNSQILSVMNTQRANVTMVQQVSYVKDFEVEVAQAAFIADPVVDILQDGIVLDVKPTISHDRKYITLELRPTVAELQQPIPTFTSSLAGATLAVTMQLPELNVRTVNTTVKVPDGGTILIGGLKKVFNKERKAEIPWLSSLPVVSLLFKTEGRVEENESLMIMVRATITDVFDAMKNY